MEETCRSAERPLSRRGVLVDIKAEAAHHPRDGLVRAEQHRDRSAASRELRRSSCSIMLYGSTTVAERPYSDRRGYKWSGYAWSSGRRDRSAKWRFVTSSTIRRMNSS